MSGLSQVNKMRIIKFGSKGMLLGPLSALYRRIRFLLVQTRIRCKWCFIFKCVVKSECFWREQNVTNLASNSDGRMRMCSDLGPQSPTVHLGFFMWHKICEKWGKSVVFFICVSHFSVFNNLRFKSDREKKRKLYHRKNYTIYGMLSSHRNDLQWS